MKKLLVILLAVSLLTGCATAGIPNAQITTVPPTTKADPPVITPGASGGDRTDVALEIESIDNAIHGRWTNKTEWTITFGEYFSIDICKDGTWVPCKANEDLAFKDIAYELQPHSEMDMLYHLEMFDVSKNGLYRITAECAVQAPEAPEKCRLWAEFTIGASAVILPPAGDDQLLDSVVNCDYNAQYIRTDGYHDGAKYPIVTVIRSVDELNAYYEQYKDLYNMGTNPDPASDSTIGFADAMQKYDESYFAKQALILILLEEGSGSVRHEVSKAGFSGNQFVVSIDAYMPGGVGTCDMAEWHIFIEPEAGLQIPDEITVFYNGKNTAPTPEEGITQEQAIEIAKQNSTQRYDLISATYDHTAGVWIVLLSSSGGIPYTQGFYIDLSGKIIHISNAC